MLRALRVIALLTLTSLLLPSVALAAETAPATSGLALHVAVSLVGLVVAVVLLVQALAVRSLARGGAVADKISYVVLAVVCLAASALAAWSTNFVADVTLEQTNLASELLVIVAMVFLALYFASVGASMREYLHAITERLGSAQPESIGTSEEEERA